MRVGQSKGGESHPYVRLQVTGSGPMSPHRTGQTALPILEGSNAHTQFGAELSLGEAVRSTVLKKDL